MRLRQRLVLEYIRTKFKLLSTISKRKAAKKALKLFFTPQYRNRKRLPPVFEKAEKITFSYNKFKIAGYRWNHPSEKKVLILHGFESSVINFDRYVRPLVKNGYEVLAFDAPAHGRSSGKSITGLLYKEFIKHIYENYGPIHSFIAHSFGGLALSLALEEMNHNEKDKVVFIAPATETTTAINSFFRFLQLDDGVRKEFEKGIEKLSTHPPEWFSITRAAENIKAKVLWVHDENDYTTPLSDVQTVINRQYPNFQFRITKGLGHSRIYKDNNTHRAIISFLSKE